MQLVSSVVQHFNLNGTDIPVPRRMLSCLHARVWLGVCSSV